MERKTTLPTDRAVHFSTAKTFVFSEYSVLCLASINTQPGRAWESKIKYFLETRCLKELDRIDGTHVEFELQRLPGFTLPCGPKPIRTMSRVFGINQQIRIRFSSLRNFFLNDSNFWCVQSSITCNETVHVLVLWPVCTHAIPFRMLWCL